MPLCAYRGADGQLLGFDVEMTRAALKQLGLRGGGWICPGLARLIELRRGGWTSARRIPAARTRGVCLLFAPVIRSRNVLFVRRAVAGRYPRRLSDLLGTDFRLGAQIGVSYGPSYDA